MFKCKGNHTNKSGATLSRWNKIIILDSNKNPIDDKIYELDGRAKILTKMKRQKRRDLGKVTGKKKFPKNWKMIIEKLDMSNDASGQIERLDDEMHSKSMVSNSETENQNYDNSIFDKLISIDWLLNQPAEMDDL